MKPTHIKVEQEQLQHDIKVIRGVKAEIQAIMKGLQV